MSASYIMVRTPQLGIGSNLIMWEHIVTISSRFKECLKVILKHEGGFVDNKNDRGGRTNFGITQKVYDEFNASRDKSLKDVREITSDEVGDIYYTSYWLPASCDNLPKPLDILVFDFAVNSGVRRATRTLQLCLGVSVDGSIGKQTLAAVTKIQESGKLPELCEKYMEARSEFFKSIVARDSSQQVFLKGWLNRIAGLEKEISYA